MYAIDLSIKYKLGSTEIGQSYCCSGLGKDNGEEASRQEKAQISSEMTLDSMLWPPKFA